MCLITSQIEGNSLCKSQRDCKRLVYKNENPYVLSLTHLKGKSVSKRVHVLFPFFYKEYNCFRKSSLSDCVLHFCSWGEGMAGFVSLFSFPFFLQKRKYKLLPSAIPVEKLFTSYSKFKLFILECVTGIKKVFTGWGWSTGFHKKR